MLGFENIPIITASRKDPFQVLLEELQLEKSAKEKSATIKDKCPKCGNQELEFYTMQLRSADEGQTIFYTCTACSYKYSINS